MNKKIAFLFLLFESYLGGYDLFWLAEIILPAKAIGYVMYYKLYVTRYGL